MMQHPQHLAPQRRQKPFRGLEITIIVLGAFGFLFWANVIGFSLGYCLYAARTTYGLFILIPVNVGYIFYTSRIIFGITAPNFPNPGILRDVRKIISRLVAVILVGCAVFVTATVWFCILSPYNGYEQDAYTTFFSGSFSFIWAIIVVAVAGAHETKCSKLLAAQGIDPPAAIVVAQSPPSVAPHAQQGAFRPPAYDPYAPLHATPHHAHSAMSYTNPLASHGDTPM